MESNKELLQQLVSIAQISAGKVGGEYPVAYGAIVPKWGSKAKYGDLTRILKKLGFKCSVQTERGLFKESNFSGRSDWAYFKYIKFAGNQREEFLKLIKMVLDNDLDMNWRSMYDPLQEDPTLRKRVFKYGEAKYDLAIV